MPISPIEGYPSSHWSEVQAIITEAIAGDECYSFKIFLVSDAEDVGLIHKRIVQNLYEFPIVVCDLSSKNPNVMLELGMRLAFDKPTVLVKDDRTNYTFDAGVIEHLDYPADLRFGRITEFQTKLQRKVNATYKASLEQSDTTSFLKAFGRFTVQKLDEHAVSGQDALVSMIAELQQELARTRSFVRQSLSESDRPRSGSERIAKLSALICKYRFDTGDNDLKASGRLLSYLYDILGRSYDSTSRFEQDAIRALDLVNNLESSMGPRYAQAVQAPQ